MNRILIMVLSYKQEPYLSLMLSQQSTWDSLDVDGVKTIYYYGGQLDTYIRPKNEEALMIADPGYLEAGFNITDEYYLMAGKFQQVLELVKDWEYDYIFRTNSSSYVCKQKLKDIADRLPKEKLYAGWTFTDSEDFGGKCVSGAGCWLSRDTAEILRKEIDPNKEIEEDVYASRILRRNGIVAIDDKSRVDYPQDRGKDLHSAYHIRFKGPHGNRYKDAEDMRLVHQKIINR